MERCLQSLFFTGDIAGGAVDYSSEMDFLSLLNVNHEKKLLPPLDLSSPPSYRFFPDDFHSAGGKMFAGDGAKNVDLKAEAKLKQPKAEPSPNRSGALRPVVPFDSCPIFHQLPELQSYEQVHDDFAAAMAVEADSAAARIKRAKSSSSPALLNTDDPYILESIIRNFQMIPEKEYNRLRHSSVSPARPVDLARKRRQTLSDKARMLQKLMPWEKKMDTATMYEEAYKYIKFLEAQVSVLRSMPKNGDASSGDRESLNQHEYGGFGYVGGDNMFGGLGMLNRQQLLEVLVNSPVAQTVLYSKGCCIYSIEQLAALKQIAAQHCLMFNRNLF